MKICYVCNEYPPNPHGGIGTYVKDITMGLAARGHEITVVGIGVSDKQWTEEGVNVVELAASGLPTKIRGLHDRFKIYGYLKQAARAGKYDLIEVPDYQGWLPFKFDYCPVIVRLHLSECVISNYQQSRVSRQISCFERKTLRPDRVWVGVSKWAYEETVSVIGKTPNESRVIYYPVTTCEPHRSSVDVDRYVLYAGTISERKGALTLARAADVFLAENPDLSLVYAGPPISDSIEGEIRGIIGEGLSERVYFTGRVSRGEVISLMTNAKIFAFPSQLETFGLVIAEAMLCGAPTICCDAGPCPEFVSNGKTGVLIPVDDDKSLVKAVCQILNDDEYAQSLSDNGREYISGNFSIDKAIQANLDLYTSVLEKNSN